MSPFFLLVLVVVAALVFDFINGFHDTANAIATVVSTGVLRARTAVLMAAVLNVGGAFAGTAVASTMGKDILDPTVVTQPMVLSALIAAIIWNLFTWWFGIPSSSSHALVGGMVGAGLIAVGVLAAAAGRRWMLYGFATLCVLGSVAGLYDFWRWGYDYGHNLDPHAIIKIPGMTYQPPLIGSKQLLNFNATSLPATGGWILIVAVTLAVLLSAREFRLARRAPAPA